MIRPPGDPITQLIAAEQDGEKLTTDELITTCILLLNAGHKATVHSMGNAIKTLLEQNIPISAPLARLELQIALPVPFNRLPGANQPAIIPGSGPYDIASRLGVWASGPFCDNPL